ncbi:MAG: hypothetical protein HYV07_29885 [Deltaproteobacteria bacterium]|nr:hypothetical protein [Deltaproteobacteria bacterium]
MVSLPLLVLVSSPAFLGEHSLVEGVAGPWAGLSHNNWETPPFAVASDGTNHVVLWTDHRANALMAARVSPSGTVLDPVGTVLWLGRAPGVYPQGHVALAFGAGEYLAVFSSYAERSGYSDGNLTALRVRTDLSVVDPAPIVISSQAIPLAPTATFDGSQFVVAWSGGSAATTTDSNGSRHVARVSVNGIVLDPGGVTVEASLPPGYSPGRVAVASAGGTTAVVWQSVALAAGLPAFQTKLRRRLPDGTWVDPSPVSLGSATRYPTLPAIAANPSGFRVAWLEGQFTTEATYSVESTTMGVTGDAAPASSLVRGGFEFYRADPSVVWTGSGWAVSVSPSGMTARAFIFGASSSGSADLPELTTPAYSQLIAGPDRLLWIAASYVERGGSMIAARRLSSALAPLDAVPIIITLAAPAQDRPVVASGPTHALAVWVESTGKWPAHVRGARVSADGSSLDPSGIDIHLDAFEGGTFVPLAVAWNGTDHVVAWLDRREGVYAGRVAQSGLVRDPDGAPILPNGRMDVSLAALPTGLALVCARDNAPGRVYCVQVDASLQPVGSIVDVSRETAAAHAAGVVGDRFAIAWTTPESLAPGRLMLSFLDSTGSLTAPVTVSSDSHWPTAPAIASAGAEGQLVWVRATAGLVPAGVAAVEIDPSLQLRALAEIAPSGTAPSVARAGAEWLIGYSAPQNWQSNGSAMVRRRSLGGAFPEPALPAREGYPSPRPSVGAVGDGFVVVYSAFSGDLSANNVRAFGRALTDGAPNGASCALDSDCHSRACIASVCCNSRCALGSCSSGSCELPDAGVADDANPDAGMIDAEPAPDSGSSDAEPILDGGSEVLAFSSNPELEAVCQVPYEYQARAEGPRPVTYALSEKPPGMSVTPDGLVTWEPGNAQKGEFAVELMASDARETVRQLFTITVSCESPAVAADDCDCRATRVPGGLFGSLALVALAWCLRPVKNAGS